ncbi:MAG: hypothetical protein Q9214_003876 [Letrouitia sp. 1 TL-2023]
MWRYQLGYLLHPKIATSVQNLKVADVACGTGAWLIETARAFPEAQFDGFDISSDQFPAKKRMPKNVTFSTLDAVGLIPQKLLEKYDVVHIALFAVNIRNENPVPVLMNLIAMLRPGGFLQWEESDICSMHASLAGQELSECYEDSMISELLKWLASQQITSRWVREMDSLFRQHELKVIDFQRLPICNELAKPYTDMQIMALEDLMENFVIPSEAKGTEICLTPEKWRSMFQNMVRKCREGMSNTMDMAVAVGQKSHR